MNGLEVVEIPRRGLLSRLVGHTPREHAFIALRNLLAGRPLAEVTRQQVDELLTPYKLTTAKAHDGLRSAYDAVLTHFAADATLTEEELRGLAHLQRLFDLTDDEARTARTLAAQAVYRKALLAALGDARLSDTEKADLDRIVAQLGLTREQAEAIYAEEVKRALQLAFDEAVEDRRLIGDEDRYLARMAENFGITYRHDAKSQAAVDRFRVLGRIHDGDLPTLAVPVVLQRGEACHAQLGATLAEIRAVTTAVRYSGPTASIRIMKGVRWRMGSVSVQRVSSQVLTRLDTGTLYLTNTRLFFDGATKNVSIPLKRVTHFTLYSDGIGIQKDRGRDQYFLGSGDLELTAAILDACLRASR